MSIKLHYFDARGVVEPIRIILAYGGEKWEDCRFPVNSFPGVAPEHIKAKCQFGQVPLVEFEDGKTLVQSLAISRYFARKYKLVPEDPYKAAVCDQFVDAIRDMMTSYYTVAPRQSGLDYEKKLNEVMRKNKDKYLSVFNSIIKANGGKHLFDNTLSWADIWLTHAIDHFQQLLQIDLLADLEYLKNLKENVFQTKNIKGYLETRSKSNILC